MSEPVETGPEQLAPAFNFRVSLKQSAPRGARLSGDGQDSGGEEILGDGGFQECSGLEIEMDVQEHQEGGRNDGVVRFVGRGRYSNLVLKRGMFHAADGEVNPQLWLWIQQALDGRHPVRRYDGVVEVLDRRGEPASRVVATWAFSRGLPAKISGPSLDARTGEIAIEEIQIAHEGLRLEASS